MGDTNLTDFAEAGVQLMRDIRNDVEREFEILADAILTGKHYYRTGTTYENGHREDWVIEYNKP